MADQKTIDVYNAKASDYADKFSRTKPDRDLRNFIDSVPKGGLVLDLGCGPGNSAAMMQSAGLVAEAMDASAQMVELACTKYGLNVKQATFDDLDANARYDGIWANFSLLHASKPDMPRHLAAIHKALKPGGHFHIGMKLGTGEKRDTMDRMYTYYEEAELKDMMQTAGFTLCDSRKDAMTGLAGPVEPFIIVTAYA
jgi:trans-aconitate methyltransferase